MDRIAVLTVLLALALGVGVWRLRMDGRYRPGSSASSDAASLDAAQLGVPLGSAATLVQFSTTVCGPCRTAARVLSAVAGSTPGVRHVEVDAEQRLDLARRFRVLRTPTVLVLDGDGLVVRRSTGVPSAAQVRHALAAAGAAGGDDGIDGHG